MILHELRSTPGLSRTHICRQLLSLSVCHHHFTRPAPTLTSQSISYEQQLQVRVEQPSSIPLYPPKTKRTLPPSQVSHVTFESRPGGGLKRHSVTLLCRYLWQYTGNLLGVSRPVTTAARNRPVDFHGRPVLKRCQAGAHRARSCYWVFGEGVRFIGGLGGGEGRGGRVVAECIILHIQCPGQFGQYRRLSKRPARGRIVVQDAAQVSQGYKFVLYMRYIVRH